MLTKTFFLDKRNEIEKEIDNIYSNAYYSAININHYSSLLEFNIYQAKIQLSEIERDIYLIENGISEPKFTPIFKNFLNLLENFDNIIYHKYMIYINTQQLFNLLNLPKEKFEEVVDYGEF